jgi:1-acyl-sn-glycerol-3-phosphate acyltransferase
MMDHADMPRTILFFSYFWVSLFLATPFCLLYLILKLLGLGKPFRGALRLFAHAWARSMMAVCGIEVDARGLELIPDDSRICFVGNHQGDMDIVIAIALIKRTIGFVAKKQALYMPVLNVWIPAFDSIFIDRDNVASALKSIEKGVRKIRSGSALILFPEGTRSRGPTMGVFRNGSFKLATRAEATIVPISIDGTYKIWEEKKRIRPGRVSFIVHEPIRTEGMSPDERKLLPGRVRAIIASGLGPSASIASGYGVGGA